MFLDILGAVRDIATLGMFPQSQEDLHQKEHFLHSWTCFKMFQGYHFVS